MFRGILPKEFEFFDYFEKHIVVTQKACDELLLLADGKKDLVAVAEKIKEYEHENDTITHLCVEALHKTFITPIERSDIHQLMKRLDDITDNIDQTMSRMVLYQVSDIPTEIKEVAEILAKSTGQIEIALKELRTMKNIDLIKEKCIKIRDLENDGDQVFKAALFRLFQGTDAIHIIKWKEIFERLEKAVDRCEAVANTIEGIVIASA